MIIGVPKEQKVMEGRVGLIPSVCGPLVSSGHTVVIESGAGAASGYSDDDYKLSGALIVESAAEVYQQAKLVVKVKEPVDHDLQYINADHIIFCFLHLAANRSLISQLSASACTAIAFESVHVGVKRVILEPMSKIAGSLAVQIGTHLLHQPMGGRGVLLGGVEGTDKGHVVVLGAGVAGQQAADLAACMNAEVTVLDINSAKLDAIRASNPAIKTVLSSHESITDLVQQADLLIGAVLQPDRHAPRLVSEAMVKSMPKGSVIVDIAIDQGGCVETIRPTSYDSPTYIQHDVTHFGVTNMPGAVPRTASQALSEVIAEYVKIIADNGYETEAALLNAVNVERGKVVLPALLDEIQPAK